MRRAEKEFTTAWDDLARAKVWAMEVLGSLAHHSITGIWKPSFIPAESAQVVRVLWAARGEAVRAATRASNRLNKYGIGYAGSQSAVAAKRSAGALHNISSREVIVALRHGPCFC